MSTEVITPLWTACIQALYRLVQSVGVRRSSKNVQPLPNDKVGPKDDGRRVNFRRRDGKHNGSLLKSGPKLGGDRSSYASQVDAIIDDVVPSAYLSLRELGVEDTERILSSRIARRMVRTAVRIAIREFRRQSARDAKLRERMAYAAQAHGYAPDEVSDGAKLAMVRDIVSAKRRGTPEVKEAKQQGAVDRWARHNAELIAAIRANTSVLPTSVRTFRPGTQTAGNGWKLEDRANQSRVPTIIDASEGGTGGSVRKDSEGIEG